MFKVQNLRKFYKADFGSVPADFTFDIEEYSNEDLRIFDFVIGELVDTSTGEIFSIVHGWPGDNPCGVVFNGKDNVVAYIGDCIGSDHPITLWYENTENVHDLLAGGDKVMKKVKKMKKMNRKLK